MRKRTPIARFWRSYVVSEVILLFAIFSGILRNPPPTAHGAWLVAGAVAVAMLTMVPLVPAGSSRIRRRIGTVGSGLLCGMFGTLAYQMSVEIQITGGEGPRGEGSLLAALMGMAFFTALFIIPWAITLVRGIVSWNSHEENPAKVG